MFKNCYEITISCVDLQDEDLAVDRFCPRVVRVIDIRIRSCLEGIRKRSSFMGRQLPFCWLRHQTEAKSS